MTKTVMDVGNCSMDHESLRAMLEANFKISPVQAHSAAEALDFLRANGVDLLLVNRIFDRDQDDGVELIKRIKADPELAGTACMLISNFAEFQQQAVAAGAEPGFGKQRLQATETRESLARLLT